MIESRINQSANPIVMKTHGAQINPAQVKKSTWTAAGGFQGVMLSCPIGCMKLNQSMHTNTSENNMASIIFFIE